MRLLLVPDLHLGAGTSIGKDLHNTGLNSRVQDQKDLLNFVSEKANTEAVDGLVLLGDIWQSAKPDPTVVHIFLEWLLEISKHYSINVIQGNHDFIRGGSNKISMLDCIDLTEIPNCNIYTEIGCEVIDQVCYVYVPYTDMKQIGAKTTLEAQQMLQKQIKEAIPESGKVCQMVCFGHLALEGSMWVGNEAADDHNEIFFTKKMAQELDFHYVFMGHVHKHQVVNKKPFMQHIGSLDRTKFTGPDATDKYITLFQDDPMFGAVHNIKLPCRNLVDIAVSIPNSERNETDFVINIISLANKPLEGSIARIRIEGNSSEYKYVDRKRISEFLNAQGVFNISSITEIKHSEQVLKNDVGIDENISHDNAIDIYVKTLTGTDGFKEHIKKVCKKIIKEVRAK